MSTGMRSDVESHHAPTAALVSELGGIRHLLRELLHAERSELFQIAVSDREPAETCLENFPTAGAKRMLVRRTGNQLATTTVDTTGELILGADDSRFGGQVINKSATSGVTLYLADSARAGVPTVWLGPNGGSWDLTFGKLPWSGNVFGVADSGTVQLAGGTL